MVHFTGRAILMACWGASHAVYLLTYDKTYKGTVLGSGDTNPVIKREREIEC